MAKTKTKGTAKTVGDTPVPQPITISSTNPKIMADNIKKLEKAIKGADDASEISYDNTASHLTASNVQAAIDEVVGDIGDLTAGSIAYDNTGSGLTADDVQEALDEVNSKNAYHVGDTFQTGYAQIMGLINSESRFETYVILPKPVGDDVNGVTITGTINNLRADGVQFTEFSGWGGSLNSRDGIVDIYVDGAYTGHNLQAGQVAITSFTVTFVHNE